MRIARGAAVVALVLASAACSGGDEPETSDQASSAEESEDSGTAGTDDAEGADGSDEASGVPDDVEEAVAARMTAMNGLFGDIPVEAPEVLTADEFNVGAPEEQVAALDERGFEAGAYQNLQVPETTNALRAVLLFESERGAADDVASGVEDLPGEAVTKTFDVPGVPGAKGLDIYGQTGLVGRNVAFNVGEYEYLLGYAAEAPPSKQQPTRAEVADVAAQWYDEVSALD